MTTTATTVKRQLLAARISQTRSLNNEAALKWELHKFFLNLKDKVLKELHEYYPDDTGILLEGHLDLILAPIFESQQKYYNILRRFNRKEYNFGVREAKRLVKLAHNNNSGASKSQNNVKLESLFDAGFEKDDLFATQKWSEETLLNHSFTASETTMNRVDRDINNILTDGYKSGKGIPHVRDQINKRFNQLADWEAQRIARTEIHNAHQMGIINTYNELGIQYVQWSSTHDTRTRGNKPSDKANHVKLDGEIIPLGGTFSNGLEFPGDTKGPLREWINCRCSLIPFIIPDGYMAPSFSPFRESDLVPTLDLYNYDDIVTQATSEMREEVPNEVDSLLAEFKRSSKEWDINRLTPQEKEHYLKQKKNYLILKNAMDNGDYSKLDELEDLGGYYAIRNKKSFLEYTDNGTDFDSWLKDELDEYLEDIEDYETIIKDTNLTVTIKPKGIKWKNKGLKEYRILNDDGKYVPVNQDEKFITYYFKDENLTILESVDMDTSRVRHVYNSYKKLPKSMKKTREIVLSSQKPRIVNFWGQDSYVGGYVTSSKADTRIIQFKKTVGELNDTLVHESAHLLEKDKNFYISNSKEYILAFKKDQQRLLAQGYSLEETYITPYAREFTEEFVSKRTLALQKYGDRQYSEDFAESVKMYLRDKKTFTEKYPNKAKVIEKAIKGEYSPKNITSYRKWYEVEKDRFKVTEEEFERERLIKIREPQNKEERDFLDYVYEKRQIDYLYNKKLEGIPLDDFEEKAFEDLTKKWKKKLNFNEKNVLEEISSIEWTKEDEKRLNELLQKEKEDSFDSIFEQFELMDLEDKKKLYQISKTNSPLQPNKFGLTKGESQELIELQELKKKEGKLKFLQKTKLKNLETQNELNELHNKYVLQGKLSEPDAKRYVKLHNNTHIVNKFKVNLIKNTDELRGITPKETVKPKTVRTKSKWEKNTDKLKEDLTSTVEDIVFKSKTNNPKEAIDDLVKLQKLIGDDLDLAVKWSGDANIDMNAFLRGVLKELQSSEFSNISELKKEVNKLIKLIDNMPTEKCLQEDTLLYRGISLEYMTEEELLHYFRKGRSRKLKQFTSTTYNVDVADDFAEYSYGEGYIIKIHAPKGTKGVGINGELGMASEEEEYLLSPNQKFKTLNIDTENHIIDILLVD